MFLITIGVLTKNEFNFRYFISNISWEDTFELANSDGIATFETISKGIKDYGFIEISFEDIPKYNIDNTREMIIYDGIDQYEDMQTIPHWMVWYEDAFEEDFVVHFGTEKDAANSTSIKELDVDSIINSVKSKYSGKTIELDKDVFYAVPSAGSLDCDYAQGYYLFSNEEDADAFISLFKEGEYGPYIYLNSEYEYIILSDSLFENLKFANSMELISLMKTKKIVLKQPIFSGVDVYN